MSDLNKKLKEKYQAEVNAQFTEAAWNSFQQYQIQHAEAKRNRKGIFWIFLFGIIALSGMFSLMYLWPEQHPFLSTKNVEPATALNNQKQIKNNNILIPGNPESTKEEEKSAKISNYQEHQASELKTSNSLDKKTKEFILNQQNDESEAQEIIPGKPSNKEIKAGALPTTKYFVDRTKQEKTPLLPNKVSTLSFSDKEIVSIDPIIPIYSSKNKTPWSAMISIGMGKMDHRSMNNVNQYFIQNNFQYQISNHWRIQGLLAFQRTNFTSKVQNLSLGIRSVPLPRSTMNLSQVISKTTYFETGIGLAYEFKLIDKINIATGSGLRYITELNRNLTYEFEDSENRMEEIFSSLDQLNSHPYNLDIHTDLFYSLQENTAFCLSASYIKSLGNSAVKLPAQWRISTGIRKNF